MNGHLILDTPIAVDFWNIRKCSSANVFFLSHIHSDHTVGLTSSWSRPIYCSKLTGELLCHKISLPKDLIRPLELDSPTLIPLNPSHSEMVTVTAIDANHCPGSVMFLFQGYFGTILYTGDFRYSSKMFVQSPISDVSVDVLYLDNTYCDPLCIFSSREEAKEKVFKIIESYPDHDILLGMQSIGKPDLLISIAEKFREYIGVSPSMYKYLEILEVPNVFQIDTPEHECRLRVVPAYFISKKLFSKLTRPTIAILTTALYVGLDGAPYSNQDSVYVVPYSDHSSYVELQEFVEQVNPGRIVPIVGREAKGPFNISFAKRADMTCFDHLLSKRPQRTFTIPAGVDVTEARYVCQSNVAFSAIKKRKRSLGLTVTKSITSKGVVFEVSPQKSKNLNVQKKVAQSPDDSPDPPRSPVIEAIPTNSALEKPCTSEKMPHIYVQRFCPLKKTTPICVEKPCPSEKSTHITLIPNSNNDLGSRAPKTPNLNPDSCSAANTPNTSQRADLEILKDVVTKNHPSHSPVPTGSESGRDRNDTMKVPDNHPSLTIVQESNKNSEMDEDSEKDTSSSTSSTLSVVYNIQPVCQIVRLNEGVSLQPARKRKLPPMFDKESHSAIQRRCTDYWNSYTRRTEASSKETRRTEASSKETSLSGSVCAGEGAQNGEADLEGENEVATPARVTSLDLSPGHHPASSKTCQPHRSVFLSDYIGRFDIPGLTSTSCQKVFSSFVKKQRLKYTKEP